MQWCEGGVEFLFMEISPRLKFSSESGWEKVEKQSGFVERTADLAGKKGVEEEVLMAAVPLLGQGARSLLESAIPLWSETGPSIERTLEFSSFASAIDFVVRVAQEAERVQHHPDIRISWRTVKLSLTTHSSGGLTEKDVSFALLCDGMERNFSSGSAKQEETE